MKKKILFLIILLLITKNVYASATERQEVKLINCMSSSTAWVEVDGVKKVVRLIAYDSLDTEIESKIEKYTCDKLKKATKIEIAYETEYDKVDKYNRELVWLFVDDELLQDDLIRQGYGEVNNAKKVFEYTESLCASELSAVSKSLGIWSLGTEVEDYCKSDVTATTTTKIKKEVKKVKRNDNESPMRLVVISLVGIVVLCIMVGRGKKHEKKR